MNSLLSKIVSTIKNPLRILKAKDLLASKSLPPKKQVPVIKNQDAEVLNKKSKTEPLAQATHGIYKDKSALYESGLWKRISAKWDYCEENPNISKRLYPTYDEYVFHQKAKLALLNLDNYDHSYRKELRLRLKSLDIIKDKKSVLCLAARAGSEVKAFIDLGYFAVGLDLNPGEDNRYVVSGDFHNLQFADDSVDIVFTNSLDHIYNLDSFIKEVGRVLRSNGVFISETVNGSEEGREPGFFESLWWRKIDDITREIENRGMTLVERQSISYPWQGEQLIFKNKNIMTTDAGLLFQIDEPFNELYKTGLALTGTPDRGDGRKARFYNLVQWLGYSADLPGSVAECGCWKGLSSYLICKFLSKWQKNFDGTGMHIVDSFEGLSEPTEKDFIQISMAIRGKERKGMSFKSQGAYAGEIESVRKALNDFPNIELIQGWIPEVLSSQPERQYRFVHIDLDLYEPIRGAVEYYFSRMVPGGIIICDDYGSLFWPGAKKALDEAGTALEIKILSLASGQGVLIKPY